jgi:hypothetical protein
MDLHQLLQGAQGLSLLQAAPPSPRAYLDPGSGSILLQLLVAGILGGLFVARAFWGKIKARITGKPQEKPEDEPRG